MRLLTVALILGLSAGVAFAGGGPGGTGGHGSGKKSGGSGFGGSKSGSIQPETGGKGEMPHADPAGKGGPAGKGDLGGKASSGATGDLERRLGELQTLRERQVISDDEYQRYRRQVLDDFARPTPAATPR